MSQLLYPYRVCEKHGPFHQLEILNFTDFDSCNKCEDEREAIADFDRATRDIQEAADSVRGTIPNAATPGERALLSGIHEKLQVLVCERQLQMVKMPKGDARTGSQFYQPFTDNVQHARLGNGELTHG